VGAGVTCAMGIASLLSLEGIMVTDCPYRDVALHPYRFKVRSMYRDVKSFNTRQNTSGPQAAGTSRSHRAASGPPAVGTSQTNQVTPAPLAVGTYRNNRTASGPPAMVTSGPSKPDLGPRPHEGEKIAGVVKGLGYPPQYGLVNQLLVLLGVVLAANQKGIRHLSADSLKFHAGWDSCPNCTNGNTVNFADLFNITHWNERALKKRPLRIPLITLAVEANVFVRPTNAFVAGFSRADWGGVGTDTSEDRFVCYFWESLRPSASLSKVVEAVRPAGVYGVLHARIENDLRAKDIPSFFWQNRVPLPEIYGMIRKASHPCIARPDSFYMCVMASDVTEPEEASMLERRVAPWPNLSLQLGGSDAVRKAGLEGSKIQGAVIDFEIARRANFFIGSDGVSTFKMAIITSRKCAGIPCSFHYGRHGGIRVADFSTYTGHKGPKEHWHI